jgi:hypothetical protein
MTTYQLSVTVLVLLIAWARPVAGQQYSTNEFEAFLVPVIATDVQGAHGTVWTTDLWFRNNSIYPVTVLGTARISPPPTIGVTQRLELMPTFRDEPGTFLLVTKTGSEDVQFDLRLFNVADADDSVGTKLPVVRASQFAKQVNLINVPTGFQIRSALRVYVHPNDFWSAGDAVTLTVYSHDDRLLATAEIPLRGTPKYGAILSLTDTLPQIVQVDRVRLHIKSQNDVRLWAFVANVSNVSQRVSVVTPD